MSEIRNEALPLSLERYVFASPSATEMLDESRRLRALAELRSHLANDTGLG